ncbi:MAG: sel1 repeat family protein [Magnetococcales bacterium]|nr:sel1 repeat family protein [Magnetococcales bacterium]
MIIRAWLICWLWMGTALAAGGTEGLDKSAVVALYKQKKYAELLKMVQPYAEGGHAYAQFALGSLYQNGEGVPKDPVRSLEWFLKSAEQGYAKAQYSAARQFYHGIGTTEDMAKAFHWYQRAADQGDLDSQVNVGRGYSRGQGVAVDKSQALLWWRRAADAGHPIAQLNMGSHLLSRDGNVSADRIEGYVYLKLAAAKKDADAVKLLKSADKVVSKEEKATAQARLAEWKPTPHWRASSPAGTAAVQKGEPQATAAAAQVVQSRSAAGGSDPVEGEVQSPPPVREAGMTVDQILSVIEKEFVAP